MNRRWDYSENSRIDRPLALNLRWEDLTPFGQGNVLRTGLKVHWTEDYSRALCGTALEYLIWADEDVDSVTCIRCRAALERQIGLNE